MRERHGRHRRRETDPRRRPADGHRALRRGRFERLVVRAIEGLPEELLAYLDNVQVVIDEVPPLDVVGIDEDDILLGLYEGVPRTERGFEPVLLPDRITLFRRPIEARARTMKELTLIVQDTVVHEVAHHFGISDDRLDELGWG